MTIAFRHFPRVFSKALAVLGASLITGAHVCAPVFAGDYEPPLGSYIYQLSVNQTKEWMLQNPLVGDESYFQVGFYNTDMTPPQWVYVNMEYQDTVEQFGQTFLRFSGTMDGVSYNRFQYKFVSEYDIVSLNTQGGKALLDWTWAFPHGSSAWTLDAIGVSGTIDGLIRQPEWMSFTGITPTESPVAFYDSAGSVHTYSYAEFDRVVTECMYERYFRAEMSNMYRWEHTISDRRVTTFTCLCTCPRIIFTWNETAQNMAVQDMQQSVSRIVGYLGQGGDLYGDAAVTYQAEREVLQEYRGEYENYHEFEVEAMRYATNNAENAQSMASSVVQSALAETTEFELFEWIAPLVMFLVLPCSAVLIAMVLRG